MGDQHSEDEDENEDDWDKSFKKPDRKKMPEAGFFSSASGKGSSA
jgi:hypothetical protein